MSDFPSLGSFMSPLAIIGKIKSAAQRRSNARSVSDPLAAYRKVVFVGTSYSNDGKDCDKLSGDGRLEIDLSAKLAPALNLPTSFCTRYDVRKKSPDRKSLYITLNSEVPIGFDHVAININNDCINYSVNGNFYFDPSFNAFEPFLNAFAQKNPKDAFVYPVKILPSRVTPQAIARAVLKKPFAAEGKPVIALMLRNPELDDLVRIKKIAEILQQKHQAKFLISTGPRTAISTEEQIQESFKDFGGVQMFLWEMSQGAKNPYLWMLGAATHVVTSGTLSTTSDLLATGKPVYYTDIGLPGRCNSSLREALLIDNAVGQFDEGMLDRAPPPEAIRLSYQEAWNELAGKFCEDLKTHLARRNNQAGPNAFAKSQATHG